MRAHSADSSHATTPAVSAASAASSPRRGIASSIFVVRGNVGSDIGEYRDFTAPDMPSDTDYDRAQQSDADQSPGTLNRLSMSPTSASSTSSSCSVSYHQLRSPVSTTNRRQEIRSGFESMPRNSAKPKLATIEVLVPPRPSGRENVPLLDYNSCSDESVGVNIDCEDVTSNSSSGEAETGPIKLLPKLASCSLKRSIHSRKPRIVAAGRASSRAGRSLKILFAGDRRLPKCMHALETGDYRNACTH